MIHDRLPWLNVAARRSRPPAAAERNRVAGARSSRPLQPVSLAELALERLQERIVDGVLPEGSRLVIDQIAREFGVSLIPVREALARLHAARLVEHAPNKGYRVAKRLSLVDLGELFQARMVLESGTIEMAVRNLTPDLLERLRAINSAIACCEVGTTFALFQRFVTLNDQFHLTLIEAAGNSLLVAAYKNLAYSPLVARELFGRGVEDLSFVVQEHEAILAALDKRNVAAARKAVSSHITDGYQRFVAGIHPPSAAPATA